MWFFFFICFAFYEKKSFYFCWGCQRMFVRCHKTSLMIVPEYSKGRLVHNRLQGDVCTQSTPRKSMHFPGKNDETERRRRMHSSLSLLFSSCKFANLQVDLQLKWTCLYHFRHYCRHSVEVRGEKKNGIMSCECKKTFMKLSFHFYVEFT